MYNLIRKKQNLKKMDKGYEQAFTDERIQIANKHMKRHSTLPAVREMRNQTIIKTIFTHQIGKN